MKLKMKIGTKRLFWIILFTLLKSSITCQVTDRWIEDITHLTRLIEKNHPMPWVRISREDFYLKAELLKNNLGGMDNEKIILEIMDLVASVRDGHTQVLLNNQVNFNKWFPVRIEKFNDGLFITGIESGNGELVGSKIVKIGDLGIEEIYRIVSSIIASDSDFGIPRLVTNYMSNAVVLNRLGIIKSESSIPLEVVDRNGVIRKVELQSSPWRLDFNWSYNKGTVPGNGENTLFFSENDSLPLYLSRYVKSPDAPFWYEYLPEERMIYFQLNKVFDGSDESLAAFAERVLKFYDAKESEIEKFIIDLRFNEGGDGELVSPIVELFTKRNDKLQHGKLFLITGANTFSAASIFIGQMKKETNSITVGDIACGPLNFSSDPIMYRLPNSNLLINISRLYSQDGHPTDRRGYYPPEYFIPNTSGDYFSLNDLILSYVLNGSIVSLEALLVNRGVEEFVAELMKRKEINGPYSQWFPYTSYEMALFTFNDLIPSEKYEEALAFSQLNSEIYPESIWGWFILGMIYGNIGELKGAYDCFDRLLEIEPCHVEALWEIEKIRAMIEPYTPKTSILKELTGEYDGRRILFEDGSLKYQIGAGSKRLLTPLSETRFLLEDSSYRVVFNLSGKKVEGLRLVKWDGKTTLFSKTDL